jgi:hypothetical protein
MPSEHHHAMQTHDIVTLRQPSALVLRVITGQVWLTESGDMTDHFVTGGEIKVLKSARCVLQAQTNCLIAIVPLSDTPLQTLAIQQPRHGTDRPWDQRWLRRLVNQLQRPFNVLSPRQDSA